MYHGLKWAVCKTHYQYLKIRFGAWFSPDGTKIIWRASRPKTKEEVKEYKDLLKKNLVAPTHMEVWIANADGSNAHQVTFLEQANRAPNFALDGKHIIF